MLGSGACISFLELGMHKGKFWASDFSAPVLLMLLKAPSTSTIRTALPFLYRWSRTLKAALQDHCRPAHCLVLVWDWTVYEYPLVC